MGITQSKSFSANDIISNSLTSVLMESSMNCNVKQHALQDLTFSNVETIGCNVTFSNITQDANLNINLSCSQDIANESDLQNKFSNKLDNDLSSSIKNLNLGLNNSETNAISRIQNTIKNEINVKNIADCIVYSLVEQKMQFGNIKATCLPEQENKNITFDNIRQTIVINTVTSCLQKNENVTKAISELDTIVKNKLSSSITGIDPLVSGIASAIFAIVFGIIIFIIVISGGGSKWISLLISFLIVIIIIGIVIYKSYDQKM